MIVMNSKLFIRNLSWSVTEADLFDLFAEVGEVLSVKIPTRREDGKPRGFAFVEMATPEAGQQALQCLNGTFLHDRDLVVAFQDESRGENRTAGPIKSAKLFIRNLGYSVTENALYELFQQAGTVISAKIATDRETGEPKGFAFVEMASPEQAQASISLLNRSLMGGQEISIAFQDPNRSKNRSGQRDSYRSGSGFGREKSAGYSNRW